MRKILRRFRKPPVPSQVSQTVGHTTTAAAADDQTWLPTELLILIASYVQLKVDLVSLCRVSKTFRVICTPRLYQVVNVSTHYARVHHTVDSKRIPYLYLSLQDAQVSKVVTELRITLWGNEKCARHIERGARSPSPGDCECDSHDKALGKAIPGLCNLRTLEIQCKLCGGKHAHEFFLHRDMPRLTELKFRCFGSSAKVRGVPTCDALLKSPCMRTITALSLECDYDKLIGSSGGTRQFLDSLDFMPDLRILSHDMTDFFTDLVAARPIERLCVHGRYSARLRKPISQSSGRLTHLFMVDIISYLQYVSPADWSSYRHLRHIGTITFSRREEQGACDEMRVFQSLDALETMEINHMPILSLDTHMNPFFVPTPGFFALLDEQHPQLRRVLLVTRWSGFMTHGSSREPVLWEKTDGWNPQIGPQVEYWDMLCDKLDKVSAALKS